LKASFLLRALFPLCLVLSACQAPPVPPEVERVKTQEHELWRAGAPVYAQGDYARYLDFLRLARDKLNKEKAKIRWFRDYDGVRADFLVVLTQGEGILEKVLNEKQTQSQDLSQRLNSLGARIAKIKVLTLNMNENGPIRNNLAQADVAFNDAGRLLQQEKYRELEPKLGLIDGHIRKAEDALFSVLARYAEEGWVAQWRKWSEETIRESRKRGSAAIIVNKLERTLTIYKSGRPTAVYEIGLGKYGLSDKLYAGDEATPEGRYQVVKKILDSRFYKALLIDYPNVEDRRKYSQAKKQGLIPRGAPIGGWIEIHGGGNDSLTNGCVAVRNDVMDEIYPAVSVGTPVTIIGSLESAGSFLGSLGKS
jgi:L,D-peptidoglycan transpeptidase YkuD (ErfK/YbiS/YcfS/YnhG family)